MHIDLSELSTVQVYATLTQSIVPRPVAWIISDNGDDSYNLAPFSYFNALSSDPPMVVISMGRKPDGSIKDSRANIEARKHFTVQIAHRELAEAMTASSATLPHGTSEIDRLGLATAPMPGSDVPRLADCRIAYACEYMETHMIKQQGILFAELTHLYVDDGCVGKDQKGRLKILADKVDPIGRLGGGEYLTAGEVITFERPA